MTRSDKDTINSICDEFAKYKPLEGGNAWIVFCVIACMKYPELRECFKQMQSRQERKDKWNKTALA